MATLEFFTFFFLFFFFSQIAANKCRQSKCSKSVDGPEVRFPFQLTDLQPPECEYSSDFALSCNEQKQTILTLPSGNFTVQDINYIGQTVDINDPNNCTAKRFLDNDFTLVGSPFRLEDDLGNYTFFNCSADAPILRDYQPITCLSSDNYKVLAVMTDWWGTPPSLCKTISTAMVPSFSIEFRLELGVTVKWGVPDCRSCELSGRVCGLEDMAGTNRQLDCSSAPTRNHGLTDTAKVWLVIIGLTGLALLIFTLIRKLVRPHQPITEVSPVISSQPHVVVRGLDDLTIESYPKTALGEKWEFPKANDSTCAICLCDYQPKETLRSIPECTHHFHANCVEQWLRKNQTCPVCRKNPPEDNKTRLDVTET